MLKSFSIRNINIYPGLVLSPMSGVTCSAFRRLIKRLNPGAVGLVISEFISVEALTRNSQKSIAMMSFKAEERPYGIQIFGYDVDRMRDAALMVEQAGADLVDVNCGCPAPKVVRNGGGCELMRQPDQLADILSAIKRAVSIPLTVKIRSGWDDSCKNALSIARLAEAEGAEALAVHGRTRAQLYRGEADWEIVQQVAEAVKIPVSGSGDLTCKDKVKGALNTAPNVAGLYVGRGALENPFIFGEMLNGIPVKRVMSAKTCVRVLKLYIDLLLEDSGPMVACGKVKQLASQMCRGHEWKKLILRAVSLEQQLEILNGVALECSEIFSQKVAIDEAIAN